jgi:hypothetical protein
MITDLICALDVHIGLEARRRWRWTNRSLAYSLAEDDDERHRLCIVTESSAPSLILKPGVRPARVSIQG